MGQARRFTRIPFESEILINAKGQWYRGMSENLSLYGIYVKSPTRFEINTVIEFTIPIDPASKDDEYVDVTGVVVRMDDSGIGCQFQEVDVDAFLNLKNLIGSRCDNKQIVMDEFYTYLSRKEISAA
jgi:hypothetical protein